jgi:glycine hydroxymethyltransferase
MSMGRLSNNLPDLSINLFQEICMSDFLVRGKLAELDPEVYELSQIEAERQQRKLIMIPSESTAPLAVREALSSSFQNLYAEGYPDEETRKMGEAEILDYPARLAHFRRYSDPRYYKGVEYADVVEALARRRCAELFAANGVSAIQIFVNVQALSGAAANNAIYHALINPGDTILGMNLMHGGHLSHGSPVNRSGKLYNAVHYSVDPQTEQINYDQVEALAKEHKPKVIIAGYSSYPWQVDWKRFRAIADAVGAILLADISHVAGLIAGGVYPSPVGAAHVIMFTTHKSLCGPRGACILTTDAAMAKKIDRAVFPGEQGGPHVNVFAAQALTFKLAKTEEFRKLQKQIVKNCAALADQLTGRGLKVAFGGTDTHLLNIDCSSVSGPDGAQLSGDQAARILDIAGVVVNRNTLPKDTSAVDPSGIRMGTVWAAQRGLKEVDMQALADIIADVLQSTTPFYLEGRKGDLRRAKVDFTVLEEAKLKVRALAEKAAQVEPTDKHAYPHFYYIDDRPAGEWAAYGVFGDRVRAFLNTALASDVEALQPGQSQATCMVTPKGEVTGVLTCLSAYEYKFSVPAAQAGLAAAWLRDLSDGYVSFDDDHQRKLPGPIIVPEASEPVSKADGKTVSATKPYFIGAPASSGLALPAFEWKEPAETLRRTPVFDLHKKLGAKMIPFAGWEMPVWYTSVMEEHLAVRNAAGLFDVAHMGAYEAAGPDAAQFLDSVVGNDIGGLGVGESCYTHFLDPDANVIDDLLIYRRGAEKFLIVVNASNDDKDWTWLNLVKDGKVKIDNQRPGAKAFGRDVNLRNLRDRSSGADMRVDIALQGPHSRDILLALGTDAATRKRIMALGRTQLCDAIVGGFDLVVSRTGYTGERMAFELFVHPDRSSEFCEALIKAGEAFGLKPCGLGARDSLRTEAGLPLYGHEMGGDLGLGVAEAGFGSYVKTFKPWFIGRQAFLAREKARKGVVVRFRFNEKGVRMAHNNDPVLDKRGKVIGMVTSCAVDKEGFLTGQAFVDFKNSEEGTPVFIFQSASKEAGKAPVELKVGDKKDLPTPATVVSRFPK